MPYAAAAFVAICTMLAYFILFPRLMLCVCLLDHAQQRIDASPQLVGRAALEKPVEAKLPCLADLQLKQFPLAVAKTLRRANEKAIFFLSVRLAPIYIVRKFETLPRVLGSRHNLVEGGGNFRAPSDFFFPFSILSIKR